MAKILFNREWYEEIALTSLYESDFEQIVCQHAELLYPNFYVVPFKKTVYSNEDSAKADLALIDKEYQNWWIVEIEMSNHSLHNHVIPQVRTLSQAVYGIEEAEYLCNQALSLDLGHVLDMLKGRQPRVFIIVNAPCPNWIEPLHKYEALIEIFEIFRSDKNQYMFRVNGEYPPSIVDVVSECDFDTVLPRFLTIQSPAILPIKHGEKIKIYYENRVTEWERIDTKDKVWLSPMGINPLTKKSKYELVRHNDGTLIIHAQKNIRKGV